MKKWLLPMLALTACTDTWDSGDQDEDAAAVGCDALSGTSFDETHNCSEQLDGTEVCTNDADTATITFTGGAGGSYQAAKSGWTASGPLVDGVFTWTATAETSSGDTYTESGTWTFDDDCGAFTGTSDYTYAVSETIGACTMSGKQGGAPDAPAPVGACD